MESDGVDRISDLPDPILGKILSYLPTKTAFSTSILSTRWKTVFPFWVTPVTLDLDDSFLLNSTKKESFLRERRFSDFVDKLFDGDLPCVVDIVKLHCSNSYGSPKLESWISAAVRLKVRDLTLRVDVMIFLAERFFASFNGCETLTRLDLGKGFQLRFPDHFTLPNLKVLVLFDLNFGTGEYDDNGSDLLDGFPALEELCISHCYLADKGLVSIKSPVLKKLTLDDGSMCDLLYLDVPELEVFTYNSDWIPSDIDGGFDPKSLRIAHINVGVPVQEFDVPIQEFDVFCGNNEEDDDSWYVAPVVRLVKACSSSAHLYLGTRSIYALQSSSADLPIFENLTCLVLGCILRSEGWAMLARLLCITPSLEKLIFEEGFFEHEGGYSSFKALVESPPTCLEKHVKEINFCVFNEDHDEIKLIEYFLEHGKVIQKLELHCLPCKDAGTLERLCLLPQESKIKYQLR